MTAVALGQKKREISLSDLFQKTVGSVFLQNIIAAAAGGGKTLPQKSRLPEGHRSAPPRTKNS